MVDLSWLFDQRFVKLSSSSGVINVGHHVNGNEVICLLCLFEGKTSVFSDKGCLLDHIEEAHRELFDFIIKSCDVSRNDFIV